MSWRAGTGRRAPPSGLMSGQNSKPRYAVPPGLELAVAISVLVGVRRTFSADAKRMVNAFVPAPRVESAELVPRDDPFIVVTNHYCKPGYRVWWGTALVSAIIAQCRPSSGDVVWLLTNRWTYSDPLQSRLITPLTYVLFTRLARVYGFVSTPPMPRQARYTEEGAQSVRRVLSLLESDRNKPLIGIAPEGRDSPDGSLIEPPSGTGRFLAHMARRGLHILPVGVAEVDGALTARFGPPFALEHRPDLSKSGQDCQASTQVMVAIGRQLPKELWGAFRTQIEHVVGR